MKSRVMTVYAPHFYGLTPEQQAFADEVYALAEANYEAGGHWIVEAMTPRELVDTITSLDDARNYMGLMQEREEDILAA